jgi:hypothetical protein
VLTGILQVVNISKTYADFDNAMSHEAVDARNRLLAGFTAITGTVAEQMGNVMAKSMDLKIARMPSGGAALSSAWLKASGRLVGLGGGLFMGALDGLRAWEEYKRGNPTLVYLYVGSATIGVGVSVGMYLLANGALSTTGAVGLFVLLIGYCFLIFTLEKEKENKIQEWLQRCYFGMGAEKYPDGKIETEQLKFAFS